MFVGSSANSLDGVSLLRELFDAHSCPTVIIDYVERTHESKSPALVYANPSYEQWMDHSSLNEQAFSNRVTTASFWEGRSGEKTTLVDLGGLPWDVFIISHRWGVLQSRWRGSSSYLASNDAARRPRKRQRTSSDEETLFTPPSTRTLSPVNGSYSSPPVMSLTGIDLSSRRLHDWTRYDIPNAPDYIAFLRRFNWSKTVIGAMEGWSNVLRQQMYFLMSNPEPRCMYIGNEDDPILLYNEAYSRLIGALHPAALGMSGAVAMGPAWEHKLRAIKKVLETGAAQLETDHLFLVPRTELPLEETYFSSYTIPIVDNNNRIIGAIEEFHETTARVVTDRRTKTMQRARRVHQADEMKSVFGQVRDVLDSNETDFPFCLVFSAPPDFEQQESGTVSIEKIVPSHFELEGIVGLTKDHPLAADQLYVRGVDCPLLKQLRVACVSGNPVLLDAREHTLPPSLKVSIAGRGHDAVCQSAVIYPINRMGSGSSAGFVLLGLNPRRPYDEAYQRFIESVMDQFIKATAKILFHPEREKWLLQTRRAQYDRSTFVDLAKTMPVGLCIYDLTGSPRWKNKFYDDLTSVYPDPDYFRRWRIPMHPEDRPRVEKLFDDLITSHKGGPAWITVRVLKKPPKDESMPMNPSDEDKPELWRSLFVNFSAKVYDGVIDCVTSSVMDITPELTHQEHRVNDALETKRQSENFIDMTCHEMRNPLSAIIQSADSIIAALDTKSSGNGNIATTSQPKLPAEIQSTVLDSAQTILLCAQHQKRIVDDILTLSKLDYNCLYISPDRVRPVTLVKTAISMFEPELADAGITTDCAVDQSYKELEIDWVLLDQSRLLQVLLNLLTNAIKFTKKADAKHISIVLRVSRMPPEDGTGKVSFIPQRHSRRDSSDSILSSLEWGKGEEIYLRFDVQDTGEGLTTEQVALLFHRFSQASPKTYSKYGGSGLGLFISRELTELHGGRIGVHSTAGQGSTFAFYIKARRYVPEPYSSQRFPEVPCSEPVPDVHTSKVSISASVTYTEAAMPGAPTATVTACAESIPTLPADLHILLVEDNLINQQVTAKALGRIGCTVHVANHGLECLKFLEKSIYYHKTPNSNVGDTNQEREPTMAQIPLSVILLDQEMPYMDGLTCVRRIREMQKSGELVGHVPVIACTANARQEQVETSIQAGMDEVVTKPFRIPDLLPKIYDLCRNVMTASTSAPRVSRKMDNSVGSHLTDKSD